MKKKSKNGFVIRAQYLELVCTIWSKKKKIIMVYLEKSYLVVLALMVMIFIEQGSAGSYNLYSYNT